MAILPVNPRKHWKELVLLLSDPANVKHLKYLEKPDSPFYTWAESLADSHFFEVEFKETELDRTKLTDEQLKLQLVKIPFDFYLPFWNCVYYFPNDVTIEASGQPNTRYEVMGFNAREMGIEDNGQRLRFVNAYEVHIFYFVRGETTVDSTYGSEKITFGYNRDTHEILFKTDETTINKSIAYMALCIVDDVNKPSPVKEVVMHNVRENKVTDVVIQSQPRTSAQYQTIPQTLIVNLDKVRYRYKDKVEHGQGSEHHVRYDVRRHMRIRNNHIEWVSPHQRGKGEYKQKIYKKGVAISRTWVMVERLSTNKYIEPILVRIIKFVRKFL